MKSLAGSAKVPKVVREGWCSFSLCFFCGSCSCVVVFFIVSFLCGDVFAVFFFVVVVFWLCCLLWAMNMWWTNFVQTDEKDYVHWHTAKWVWVLIARSLWRYFAEQCNNQVTKSMNFCSFQVKSKWRLINLSYLAEVLTSHRDESLWFVSSGSW